MADRTNEELLAEYDRIVDFLIAKNPTRHDWADQLDAQFSKARAAVLARMDQSKQATEAAAKRLREALNLAADRFAVLATHEELGIKQQFGLREWAKEARAAQGGK